MNSDIPTNTGIVGERIRIKGTVQGVGFRPTVWRLAQECGVAGAVWNDGEGVVIEAWGSATEIDTLVAALPGACPPLAKIESVVRATITGEAPAWEFEIRQSDLGEVSTAVSADAATCHACLSELGERSDRRYGYPFTNCTHCGPRLSIIRAIPYDRSNTSMSEFRMCPQCQREYTDPADRRFHAQPNACAVCGPKVWIEAGESDSALTIGKGGPIPEAARLLRQGAILAVKGVGGIHLACNALDSSAVERLRRRKQRDQKAFALMALDFETISRYARLGKAERDALSGPVAPIVIMEAAGEPVAAGVAPGQSTLGFMLPYSPLHHLLLRAVAGPIVLTSGNRSDEPQCTANEDARERLLGIADFLLLHDREIVNRLDDSVIRVAAGAPRVLRRARGLAPAPLVLPPGFERADGVLGMGAELKNTFCLLRQGRAILSQHMGDLENAVTFKDYQRNLSLYLELFQQQPEILAVDLHPGYLSSKWGGEMAAHRGLQLIGVQHHHAHIAACMAEHGLPMDTPPVLGVALDGLGYGEDGGLWGAELLLADYRQYRRLAHFQPMPLLGGTRAMLEPWRNCYAQVSRGPGWQWLRDRHPDLEIVRLLQQKPLKTLDVMMERGVNSPSASSCGRLFDAVAAALGVCPELQSYEGQAAMRLESLAGPYFEDQAHAAYTWDLGYSEEVGVISFTPLWKALFDDLQHGQPLGVISARFHHCICELAADIAGRQCEKLAVKRVVLSGGVFQNRLLLEGTTARLRARGLGVLSPERFPANDGGISLGQAVIAAAGSRGGAG